MTLSRRAGDGGRWLRRGTAVLVLLGCGTAEPADPGNPNEPDTAVSSVEISPSQLTLQVGDTARLAATPRTAAGDPSGACAPTWASGNTSVAQVDADGLVTAMAPGTATVTASCGQVAGQASVTVSTSSSSVDTIFSDGFESGSLGDAGRWQDILGNFSIVTAADEGITAPGGTRVMKMQPNGGAISHFVATGQSSPYERLRLSYSLYRIVGYTDGLRAGLIRGSKDQWGSFGIGGSCPDDPNNSSQQEFFITALMQPADLGWQLRMYNYWLGVQKYQENPPVCYGTYATGPNDDPQGIYYDLSYAPSEGQWYRYEIELHLNTPGAADGWEKVWVDGTLKIEHRDVMYRTEGITKIWAVSFDFGSPTVGIAYVDDVLVTVPATP